MLADLGDYQWAIRPKSVRGTRERDNDFSVFADRLEVSPAGHLIFYHAKKTGDVVVHVQAFGTFASVEILSALTGYPTHAMPMSES